MQIQSKSKVDDLMQKQREAEEKEKKKVEILKEIMKNSFSDANGIMFLKYLKTLCFWAEQDININSDILLYKKGRRDIWAIIRNVIPKDVLAKIEIYDDTDLSN